MKTPQIISEIFKFSNISELKTYDTRKKILLTKFEGSNCVEKVKRAIIFLFFYTFFGYFGEAYSQFLKGFVKFRGKRNIEDLVKF